MVPSVNPVIVLGKVPVSRPLVVVFKAPITGSAVVPQQIPLTVIAEPPSEVITPPETALVAPSAVIATVVKVGATAAVVVNGTSAPYAVPALFVAYARTWYGVPGSNPVTVSYTHLTLPTKRIV